MSTRFLAIIITLFMSSALSLPSYAAKNSEEDTIPPAVVSIAPVKAENWQASITAIGTLSANQGIVIKPEMAGRVTSIYFRSGDYVKAGAPLMQINPDILKAEYQQATAEARLAQANYQRTLTLYNKRVFAKADLDNAFAKYQADKANSEQAKAALAQTLIRAPFAGRLGLRLVDLGDYVTAGQAITDLEASDPLRVDFSVPEIYINQIKPGQVVILSSRSYPNILFKGTVYATDAAINVDTRTLGIRAVVPNKAQKLIPGAFVDVKVIKGPPQKTIVIPQTALSYEGNNVYIYKVVHGKAVKTIITTGARKDDNIAILTGLKAGDSIITAGQLKVADGQPVISSQ